MAALITDNDIKFIQIMKKNITFEVFQIVRKRVPCPMELHELWGARLLIIFNPRLSGVDRPQANQFQFNLIYNNSLS